MERRRRKQAQRTVMPKEGEIRRVRVQVIPNLENAGLSPVSALLQKGYTIDEQSKSPDGRMFDMVMPTEKWQKEIYEPAKRRSRAQQGLRADGAVREVSCESETFKGKDVIEAGLAVASQIHNG